MDIEKKIDKMISEMKVKDTILQQLKVILSTLEKTRKTTWITK